VIILHLPNTRLSQFKLCSFPYAPARSFSALLITPRWWQPMSTCRITFGHLKGAGKEEEIWLSTASHAGKPRGCPSAPALYTFVSLWYLPRSQSTARLEFSHLFKDTTALPRKPSTSQYGWFM